MRGTSSNGSPPTDAGTDAPLVETGAEGGGDAPGSLDAPLDAPPDVDNGAPSSTYPAPHPPLPQLVNTAGGPVLTSPSVYLIFYPGYPYEASMRGLRAEDDDVDVLGNDDARVRRGQLSTMPRRWS